MKFRQITPEDLPKAMLYRFWREWFEADPWGERYRCPVHNQFDDFSSMGRFRDPGVCNICDAELVPYWTDERITEYLRQVFSKPGLVVLGGFDDGDKIIAWSWGYLADEIAAFDELPRGGLYVDHIGFDPNHSAQDVDGFLEAGEQLARQLGFSFLATRTHREADYVKATISPHRYAFYVMCPDEEDREYWAVPPW